MTIFRDRGQLKPDASITDENEKGLLVHLGKDGDHRDVSELGRIDDGLSRCANHGKGSGTKTFAFVKRVTDHDALDDLEVLVLDVGGDLLQRCPERHSAVWLVVCSVEPTTQLAFLLVSEGSRELWVAGSILDERECLQNRVVQVRSNICSFLGPDAIATVGVSDGENSTEPRSQDQRNTANQHKSSNASSPQRRQIVGASEGCQQASDHQDHASDHSTDRGLSPRRVGIEIGVGEHNSEEHQPGRPQEHGRERIEQVLDHKKLRRSQDDNPEVSDKRHRLRTGRVSPVQQTGKRDVDQHAPTERQGQQNEGDPHHGDGCAQAIAHLAGNTERKRLLAREAHIHRRLFGHDVAIVAVPHRDGIRYLPDSVGTRDPG